MSAPEDDADGLLIPTASVEDWIRRARIVCGVCRRVIQDGDAASELLGLCIGCVCAAVEVLDSEDRGEAEDMASHIDALGELAEAQNRNAIALEIGRRLEVRQTPAGLEVRRRAEATVAGKTWSVH